MTLPIFPYVPSMAWGSKKTQRWNTIVKTSGTNKRKSMTTWPYPEWTLECYFKAVNPREIDQLAGFLGTVRGRLQPFLWLDMEDFKQAGTVFGTGDGVTQRFQLMRVWNDVFYEPIKDVVDGTLVVYQNETRATITLEDDGIVFFATPPAVGVELKADFHYYWRVAFEEDFLTWEIFWFNLYKTNTFRVVTVD